ncbi:Armadillo-like helical domain-containing protein [Trichinella spiralis]|uniref:Armadillo-like helical domain-containing protein n=1 Tax=Trichinella spiralis TaxID=6334 RepID=A0ABR3KRN6_TRISP
MGKSGIERRKSVNELVCKVVSMYDKIFKSEVDDSNDEFWEELFLLWANKSQLCLIIDQISIDQMQQIKQIVNRFVSKCITTITHQEGIRVYNAVQTLGFLIHAVAKKKEVLHCSFNLTDILFGSDAVKLICRCLLHDCVHF